MAKLGGRLRRPVAYWVVILFMGQAIAFTHADERPDVAAAAAPSTTTTSTTTTTTTTTTTSTTTTTTTTVPPTTTIAPPPPPTTAPPPPPTTEPPRSSCCAHWTMEPYLGVGTWVDVFDWTDEHAWTEGEPAVKPDQVPAMAAAGIQTLFIQTGRYDGVEDISERPRLEQFIDNAHAHGMDVVGWYLPTLEDTEHDLQRMIAAVTSLDLDGFSVDIESTKVRDEAERNRRLIDVSRRFREATAGGVVGTVIINAFAIEEIQTHVWPNFPWAEIDPYYDVWQPMAYVSYREGTEWRDTERYTAASIEAMRRHVGSEPIHVVTGEGHKISVADVEGFVRASLAHGATGGGIYDWGVTSRAKWDAMAPLRN